MINLQFFPSRQIAFYTVRLFLTRSLAVLVALVLVLMTLDADPRYEVAQGTARTPQYQQDRASLLGLLRIRRTRILEADAKL